ncbi:MAG: polysaccharide deacetylase family protein [Pseudomonadota bacterium]
MGKKAMLGSLLGRSGIAAGRLRAAGTPADQLMILAYHRVLDIGEEALFPQDPELVSASVADFERQMCFVREHFTPLKLADVIDCLERGRELPRRALVVTFDDGHLDNYTHAFPVLRRLGVPATIFLSTDYIGSDRMFWFDRVALLLYSAPAGQWRFAGCSFALPAHDVQARRKAAGTLLRRLKEVPDAERLACLESMDDALAQYAPPRAVPARSALNWDEVRQMARAGIEFGSHTCSHPILTRLDDAALRRELHESRRILSEQLGQPVDTVAYPVGKIRAFDERVISISRECGYRLGVSYETGVNALRSMDRFALRRLPVERYTELPFFKGLLAFPELLA